MQTDTHTHTNYFFSYDPPYSRGNIYMLEWEEDLIQHQTSRHEIYGR